MTLSSLSLEPALVAAALAISDPPQDGTAVSAVDITDRESVATHESNCRLRIPHSAHGACVVIIDVARHVLLASLDAHSDIVRSLCALPDGSLVTAGGRHDGTVRVWDRSTWHRETDGAALATAEEDAHGACAVVAVRDSAQTLKEFGYVFGLAILPDAKQGSELYALAGARYNTVRICL